MNGQIRNFEKRIEIPFDETFDVHVRCAIYPDEETGEYPEIPPDSYVAIYDGDDGQEATGTYFRESDDTGIATVTLHNHNTTGELEEFDTNLRSFWDDVFAGDDEIITIGWLPQEPDEVALDPTDNPAYLANPLNPRSRR